MPNAFEKEFDQVRARALSVGLSAEEMLRDSIQALAEKDHSYAERVRSRRQTLSREVEMANEEVYTCISLNQPMPQDMPQIASVFCVTSSMERVARYAEEIAMVAGACPPDRFHDWVFEACSIPGMAREALSMVHDTLVAFGSSSPGPISRHATRNEEIQAMGVQAFRIGLERMAREPRDIRAIERVLLVTRALEASAANSLMAAEKIHVSITGKGLENPISLDRSL